MVFDTGIALSRNSVLNDFVGCVKLLLKVSINVMKLIEGKINRFNLVLTVSHSFK